MSVLTFDRPQKPSLRSWIVLIAAIAAVATAPVLRWLGVGQAPGAFAAEGDETLRAAGYAFAIWGLIYVGLVAYGVWQRLRLAPETPALRAVAWPSAIAMAGCALWLLVAALDLKAATVLVILGSAGAMVFGLLRAEPYRDELGPFSRFFIFWPLGLLAGWLTIASAINLLTVLTAWGVVDGETARPAALAGIGAVLLVGAVVIWRLRHIAYGLPVVWGLIAVWVAERGDQPQVATAAAAAAVAMLLVSVIAALRG
ncbi:MAG TPA: hypothetical protein VEA44_06955 [Caulobacter sp.]|nr:hypothetical protein [Caulobacter sp.]